MPTNSVSEALRTASLTADGNTANDLKCRLLMAELLGVSLPALALHKNDLLSSEQILLFSKQLSRSKQNEPLQYILGKAHFYGLELDVNPAVLIPRPETEGLVEWVHSENRTGARVLEIGTGSGAISLALKALNPEHVITATDVSLPALTLARQNAGKLGYCQTIKNISCRAEFRSCSTNGGATKIRFILADLFPPKRLGSYDIIVSNPPYISTHDYQALDKEVRLYEPKLALAAGRDGLACYRRILSKVAQYLTKTGKLYLEIGENQAADISILAQKSGFSSATIKQDLAGKDRYLRISR